MSPLEILRCWVIETLARSHKTVRQDSDRVRRRGVDCRIAEKPQQRVDAYSSRGERAPYRNCKSVSVLVAEQSELASKSTPPRSVTINNHKPPSTERLRIGTNTAKPLA